MPTLRIAQDAAADELLSRDPLALLIGMLLDQHMGEGSSGSVVEPPAFSVVPLMQTPGLRGVAW